MKKLIPVRNSKKLIMNKKTSLLLAFLFLILALGHSQTAVKSQDHYSLAIAAIKTNKLSELDAQLKHISNLDSLIKRGEYISYTLLGYACLYNNKAAIQKLIARKASINDAYSDEIYIYDALNMAIDKGDYALAKYFISLGAKVNQPYNEEGLCPLALSCMKNNYPIANLLLNHGAKADGVGDLGGAYITYPLIIAVEKRNKAIVQLLLKHGAKKNVKDSEGFTPLSLARKLGYTEIIRLLENKNK